MSGLVSEPKCDADRVQRAGHIILDGVLYHDIWVSYKVSSTLLSYTLSTHLFHKTLQSSLVDIEKTFSGLADGCAKAGKAGCKLIEITGDNATGDDVRTLITYSHDVIYSLLYVVDTAADYFLIAASLRDLSPRTSGSHPAWRRQGYCSLILHSRVASEIFYNSYTLLHPVPTRDLEPGGEYRRLRIRRPRSPTRSSSRCHSPWSPQVQCPHRKPQP